MAFAKDSAGFVHLKGTITGGTFGTTVITVPTGYRPAQNLALPVAIERDAPILTTGRSSSSKAAQKRTPASTAWRSKAG
jgi:hypothetical protein